MPARRISSSVANHFRRAKLPILDDDRDLLPAEQIDRPESTLAVQDDEPLAVTHDAKRLEKSDRRDAGGQPGDGFVVSPVAHLRLKTELVQFHVLDGFVGHCLTPGKRKSWPGTEATPGRPRILKSNPRRIPF
jgi:hypothetical protein